MSHDPEICNHASESAPSQVSAEEQARQIIEAWDKDGDWDEIASLRRIFADALTAAKREGAVEAHEQDARVGCEFCRKADIFEPAVIQMTRRGELRWRHVCPDGDTYLCERPEVRDALLALRSKGGAEP